MTLEIFNSIVGFVALIVSIFATSKVYTLKKQIKNINNTTGNNSPGQNVTGSGNVTGGRDAITN